jgi:hypothetical protein
MDTPGAGLYGYSQSCGVSVKHDGTAPGFTTEARVLDGRVAVLFTNSMTAEGQAAPDPAAVARWDAIIDTSLCN